MKKTNYLFIAAFAALILSSCNFSYGSNPVKGANRKGIYAYEAATSAHLLTNMNSKSKLMMLDAEEDEEEKETTGEVTDTMINTVKEYLPTVEAALTGEDVLSSYKEEVSDDPLYQHKMTISYKDILLKDQTIVMYYNEFVEGEENANPDTNSETTSQSGESIAPQAKLDLLDADDDEEDDEEDADDEKESRIEGIVHIGDQTYDVEGEKEAENGGELEVTFRYILSENNYIEVSQEIEADEYEFAYTIVENNKVVHEYEIEVEQDEVELKLRQAELGKYKMEFELVTVDSKNLIRCKLRNGNTKTVIDFEKVVNAETGIADYIVVK